jgi:V-type H+-transporting ATPase subunit D
MIQLLNAKARMGELTADALLMFARAIYGAGEFYQNVLDSVKKATIKIEPSAENVAGVMLPIMNIREGDDSDSTVNSIGIDKGGNNIRVAKDKFKELLMCLCQTSNTTKVL